MSQIARLHSCCTSLYRSPYLTTIFDLYLITILAFDSICFLVRFRSWLSACACQFQLQVTGLAVAINGYSVVQVLLHTL